MVQSCPIHCDPVDCNPLGSSAHRIFQARILEWFAISYSNSTHRGCVFLCRPCLINLYWTFSSNSGLCSLLLGPHSIITLSSWFWPSALTFVTKVTSFLFAKTDGYSVVCLPCTFAVSDPNDLSLLLKGLLFLASMNSLWPPWAQASRLPLSLNAPSPSPL